MNAPAPKHSCLFMGCENNATILISDALGERTDFVCDEHYESMQPPEPPKMKAAM